MGVLSFLDFLKKKPKEEVSEKPSDYSSLGLPAPEFGKPTDVPQTPLFTSDRPLPQPPSQAMSASESATHENLKAKVDLMMTQIDSMRIQSQAMNERIVQIENMVRQLLDMARR